MQGKYFGKIVIVVILLFTNAATAIISYNLRQNEITLLNEKVAEKSQDKDILKNEKNERKSCKKEEKYIRAKCPDYIVRIFETPLNEESLVTLPILNIVEYPDKKLEEKIRRNIQESCLGWMPEVFECAKTQGNMVMLSTDKYLSIENQYWVGDKDGFYVSVYNTFDMETGEVVYLDDLVYVDKEFVKLLLTEGVVKTVTNALSMDESYIYSQEELDDYSWESVMEALEECSMPYAVNNYYYKPSFYLRNNRLYLNSIFTMQSEFYVELDDIVHKLKVPRW